MGRGSASDHAMMADLNPSRSENEMSDRQADANQERPSVVGTDPDMNIGDEDPAETEKAAESDDDVDVEDLP